MSFEFWGFGGHFQLDFPSRILAILIVGLYLLAIMAIFLSRRDRESMILGLDTTRKRTLFALLAIAQILSTQLFILRLDLSGFSPLMGGTASGSVVSIALFAAVPWMLVGGLFGVQYALVIALLGGVALAGTESQGVLAALHFSIQAGIAVWILRNNFDDAIGRALRNPMVTGLLVGLLMGLLKAGELLSFTRGEVIVGINYLLGSLGEIILLSSLPLITAGIIAAIVRNRLSGQWFVPRWLSPGPYRRSLAGKILSFFLILGVLSSSILLIGDWLLAQTSAEELIETQVRQTALDAASGIPYFFQTGRSLVRRHAGQVAGVLNDPDLLHQTLEEQIGLVEFFDQITIYDTQKSIILKFPSVETDEGMSDELDLSLDVALTGVPDEVILAPQGSGQSAKLVFLTPIFSDSDGSLVGAYSAWTVLEDNPFLLPTVERLNEFTLGTGFVTEGRGRIIIHPNGEMIMRLSDVDTSGGLGITRRVDREGQSQLVYVHPVEGYAWNVIVTIPQLTITSLALRLGVRLITMIVIIGGLVLGVIYAIGRRLTQPLEHMVEVAESIARGNLEKSVPNGGEDEIGRLSVSFERMRSSLQSRLNEMDLLLAVSQQVASSLDLNDVLPPIMDGIRGLTRADFVRMLIAPDRPQLLTPVEAYQSGADPGGWTSLDKQILELSREKGHFILENPARAQAVFNLAQLSVGINTLIAFPILNEDQFVGCIWLGHQSAHAYSESETNLISIIASNLGVAVANARLYHAGEDERRRLGAMLEAIPDAVVVVTPQGVISLANPAAQVVLSVPVEEAVGRNISEVVIVEEIEELLTQSDHTSHAGEIHMADGQVFFVSVSEIQEGDSPSSGKICVLWDISHFKKLDTLKSEFVSTVSHDLKMPLTRMKGYVTMLSMIGSMNDQQKQYLRKIKEASDQMERLVDNVLDLGRIEAGLGLKLEKVDLATLILEVVESFTPQAVNRQVSLGTKMESDMVPVEIDRTLMRQALANLVDNAVNFTPAQGQVEVRASQMNGKQRISVEDNGVGISPTDQARLFEKFYRVHNLDSQEGEGSGLGLAIVKSIVEQHGGRVFVESRLGVGSTFTIELPIRSTSGSTP